MKLFDIELARQGHPICYRDGTVPDEIHICPEWVQDGDNWPVITRLGACVYTHKVTGRYYVDDTADSSRDLFLKTGKRVGWINIYETKPIPIIYETEEEARAVCATFSTGSRAFTIKIEWEDRP